MPSLYNTAKKPLVEQKLFRRAMVKQDQILFVKIGTHTCFRAYHRSCLLWPPTIVHFAGATYLPFSSSRGHLPVVGVYRVSLNLDAFSGVLLLSSSGRWSFVSRALGRGSRERPACIHTRLSFEPGWPRPIARTSK